MKESKSKSNYETQIKEITDKMHMLLHCGNERIELAAAKELLSLAEAEATKKDDGIKLDVTIRVVENSDD